MSYRAHKPCEKWQRAHVKFHNHLSRGIISDSIGSAGKQELLWVCVCVCEACVGTVWHVDSLFFGTIIKRQWVAPKWVWIIALCLDTTSLARRLRAEQRQRLTKYAPNLGQTYSYTHVWLGSQPHYTSMYGQRGKCCATPSRAKCYRNRIHFTLT